jgi:hypothetical protein
MAEPWSSVLDYACDWDSGETSNVSITTEITEYLYGCGFDYETTQGGSTYSHPNYYSYPHHFNVSQLISDLSNPDNIDVNCLDMARAIVTFGNALGTDLELIRFSGGYTLNHIDPIGSALATNNTFSTPLIDDDCRTGGFGYHAFAKDGNNHIWDATLRYDIDSYPDNVINSNPNCGETSSGQDWELPCNEALATYLSRLLDNWSKPDNDYPIDCSNPYDCGSLSDNENIIAY